LFKIGAFAKLSGVTVKTLRHYDELGLLKPARVDEESGYRFAVDSSALGRVGKPTDIADIVAFTASPDGRWVTGQMLDATGGSHL